MEKRYNLTPEICARLINDYGMKQRGKYLRGRCPECEKNTFWTWAEEPGQVQCDRKNHCGYEITSKALFPELFENLNKKYQATQANPNATADAYLALVRGFGLDRIQGWYEQGKYWHPKGDRGTASVRFYLDAARLIYWERLIDDVTITEDDGSQETRNKNFKGSFVGLWWQPPSLVINDGDEIFLVEGVLDAIALNLSGVKAVAIMSDGTFPNRSIKPHLGKKITWVLALDNDSAGREAIERHVKRLDKLGEQCSAALTSETETKVDWNDLHRAKQLTSNHIKQYRHLGRLATASSAAEKAQLMWARDTDCMFFVFDFMYRTYSVSIDMKKHQQHLREYWAGVANVNPSELTDDEMNQIIAKASVDECQRAITYGFKECSKIKSIADFTMDFLYFQRPENGEEGQYFFRLKFANRSPSIQEAFPGKSLSSSSDFKKAAMNKAPSALFTGKTPHLDFMYNKWHASPPKIVRTLDFIGYDKISSAYIYKDYAVQGKKIIKVNKQSFFELKNGGIKTSVDIRQNLTTKPQVNWLTDYHLAFGPKGTVALAWWLGSLFAEQIREETQSYPFLELVGKAASGKSRVVSFLWKLLGKEGESFNPNDSTLAGRTRKMAEVSNMPVVFNETDNEESADKGHFKKFSWDEQKDLFDGEFGRVTGVKSHDNSTRKPTFKAALMIVQNVEVQASEAILTRICHIYYDHSHHSAEGRLASDRLMALPTESVSGFMLSAVSQSETLMPVFLERMKYHYNVLQKNEKINFNRILENHAKLLALLDCLKIVLPAIADHELLDAKKEIETMAESRQVHISVDGVTVSQFWEQYDYLNAMGGNNVNQVNDPHAMNHSKEPEKIIAVSLEHFHSEAKAAGLPSIDNRELRQRLKLSQQRKFITNKTIRSKITDKSIRCWIFENA